jgi:tetratricopeptide (TPR) repeat protein
MFERVIEFKRPEMRESVRGVLRTLSVFVLVALMSVTVAAGEAVAEAVAKAYSVQGVVETQRTGGSTWDPVERGVEFFAGDKIRTGPSSRAGLRLKGGRLVRLRENSLMTIDAAQDGRGDTGALGLFSGAAHLFSRKAKEFPTVKTTEVSAAIRGTEFVIAAGPGATTVTVLDGEVQLDNSAGTLRLMGGEQGVADGKSAPQKKLVVDPTDAVQWALHFPLVVDPEDFADVFASTAYHTDWKHVVGGDLESAGQGFKGDSFEARLGRSLLAALMHDASAALAQLGMVKDSDPEIAQIYRGNLLLSVGEREQVAGIHSRLGNVAGMKGSVRAALYSQRAILELLANEKDRALSEAKIATEADPGSTVAAIARSYVHQGRRELELALDWAEKAIAGDYAHPHALARKAELLLGMGDVEEAVEVAKEAEASAGHDPYVLSVLGYSYLTHYDTEKARDAFERAIKVDATRGLAFFGNGLAMIRSGELEGGRQELEKAVHLEPTSALYRSYLGKAYFEENKEDIASKEYNRAINLDESDPTPYLYRAFNELSQNRPVDALRSVEDSIALNDNRAVYRSDFLLDQDLAVRGTTLSEVFSQLGFSRVAQLEAINSINHDYSNYSAHRLYAESLSADFLSDAQRSEQIISDLMAPLSFNVFSNLDGFSSEAGSNEYAALFDRPEHRTGIGTGWDTSGDFVDASVTQTGIEGDFGYFLGYIGSYGQGSKSSGSFSRLHQFDLNTQYQMDYSNRFILSAAFEKRDTKDQIGDEDPLFQPYVLSDDIETMEFSLSYHHRFAANAKLLGRVEYTERDLKALQTDQAQIFEQSVLLNDEVIDYFIGDLFVNEQFGEDSETLRYSVQQFYDAGALSFIAGGEVFSAEIMTDERSPLIEVPIVSVPAFQEAVTSSSDIETDSYSVYGYAKWQPLDRATFDAGINYSELQLPGYAEVPPFLDATRSERGWSPKAGVSLRPVENLTLRGAYFQRLATSSLVDIGSLEPTLVGSFSQTFQDLPGADAENWGLGIDYKIPSSTYFGVEYLNREIDNLDITVIRGFETDLDTLTDSEYFLSGTFEGEDDEHLWRAYLYQIIGERSSLTLDLNREEVEIGADFGGFTSDTDRAKAGFRTFCTSRWFAFSELEWFHQRTEGSGNPAVSDTVWLWDIGAGYRLPYRSGIVRASVQNILGKNFAFTDPAGRHSDLVSGFHFALEASFNF